MHARHMLIAALALLVAAPVFAQDDVPTIEVSAGSKSLPFALPKPLVVTPSAADEAAEIWSVIHRDLELTGYFDLIDPAKYIESGKGVEPGQFDFADWRMLNTTVLAKTRITQEGDQLVADVYIYDVGTGEKLLAKRFRGAESDKRYLGHRIADAILLAITAEEGFFSSRILAVSSRTGTKEIYLMDIDGKGVTPVTRNGSINLSPAWSPNGTSVVWTSYKRGNPDLYLKELSSGRTRVVANRPGINTGGAFHPDGVQLALSQSSAGDADVWMVDTVSGKRIQQITKTPGIDVAPSFSPDGGSIVFSSERSGGSQIYLQDLASGTAQRLTFQGAFNFDPVFSPDGKSVAFVGREGNFDIFVVNLEGRNLRRITQGQGNNEDPSWSPDGRYLLFSSTRTGRSEIWMSSADGNHQIQISEGGNWFQPSWSPR